MFSFSPSPGDGEGISFSPSPGVGDSSAWRSLRRVKTVDPLAFHRPTMVKGFHQAVVAVSFAARSSPVTGCFFPVADLSDFQTCLVTPVDLAAAADLGPAVAVAAVGLGLAAVVVAAAAGSSVVVGLAVVLDSVATVFAAADPDFAVAADSACSVGSVGPVCSFAGAAFLVKKPGQFL